MDTIRSAIARARAQRETTPVRMARARPGIRPAATGAATIRAAWADLPQVAPDAGLLQRNRIVAGGHGPDAAAIDMMRTRILQQMRDNGWRRLALTSPGAGCGTSTVALNLAIGLSRLAEVRTILLDLDLRRPSLARMLGVTPPHPAALTQVLRDRIPFAEGAVRIGDNLAMGLNDTPDPAADAILGRAGLGDTLHAIEARYRPDIVICDMPPMLAAADMMAFAAQVDCVLIVAAAERTTTQQIDACERDLARRTSVMGVVLNACHHMDPEACGG